MTARDEPVDHKVPFSLERIVFFSDAVFAIAITLLAIDIRLPEAAGDGGQRLEEAILALAPVVFNYALSFAAIGLYWLAHWRRYDYVERADEGLAVINLAHLGFIALIPFPTALLGQHGDERASVTVYVLVVSAAGIVGTLSWLYAYRRGLDDAVAAVVVGPSRGAARPRGAGRVPGEPPPPGRAPVRRGGGMASPLPGPGSSRSEDADGRAFARAGPARSGMRF